jgi:hypothetical protein
MPRQIDPNRLFPKRYLAQLDQAHLARARLLHVDSLLADGDRLRDWLAGEELDEANTFRELHARRRELLERATALDEAAEKRRPADDDRTGTVVRTTRHPFVDIGDPSIRWPLGCAPSEGSVPVPLPLQGPSTVPPPGDNTSGEILTIPTTDPWEATEPHYQGTLRAGFKFPGIFDQSYWLRNWRWVIPFPCAPCDSRLTYRVYVETGGLFRASGLSASLWNWINVRELPDVTGGIDLSTVPDYEVWPISRSWPFFTSFMLEPVWGGVTLEGTFSVKDGQAPVVAVLMGAIVGLSYGEFRIFNAGFHPWEMQLFPPGGSPDPWHFPFHAKVHYRYEPIGPVISP